MKKQHFYYIATALIFLALFGASSCAKTSPPSIPTTPPTSSPALVPEPTPSPIPSIPPPTATPMPTPETTIVTTPAPSSPADTIPPSQITGLIAVDAYDGKVNLRWDKCTAEDFDHYKIYVSKSEAVDVTGMRPVEKITAIATTTYQVTGLDVGTKYYFAVTAVDKSGNEKAQITSVSAIPTPMPRGTPDPELYVDIYDSRLTWAGTTLWGDNRNLEKPRIIEVNMLGEIIWQYVVPEHLRRSDLPGTGVNPGFDVELLPNNNILFVSPAKGVYEISRKGDIVWSYETSKISHDVDRLPNGNTIFVFGSHDQKGDAQVTEVNPKGEIVWAWYGKDYFDKPPYKDIYWDGWIHANGVERLPNGNTLISLRNFDFVVEVDPKGSVVRIIGEGILDCQHGPQILPNGNLLIANHNRLPQHRGKPQGVIEIDLKTDKVVWQVAMPDQHTWPIRDANRLPNGNTLIIGTTKIVEVTPEGKIVWQLGWKTAITVTEELIARGFYQAERINTQR